MPIAPPEGQDQPPIVEEVGVVAASRTKVAVAEDGKLLLFRPALALDRISPVGVRVGKGAPMKSFPKAFLRILVVDARQLLISAWK